MSGRKDSRVIYYGIAAFIFIWLGCCAAMVLVPVYHVKKNESLKIIIGGTVLLLLSMSAGLFNKLFFSLAMVITAVMQKLTIKNTDKLLILTALALAIYPALPTVKPEPQIGIVYVLIIIINLQNIYWDHQYRQLNNLSLIMQADKRGCGSGGFGDIQFALAYIINRVDTAVTHHVDING